jgi:transglutaminase-like putative cysteine protease
MKRALAVIVLLLVVVAGAGAWWAYGHFFGGSGPVTNLAQIVPQGPISCPEDPNNLSGIEGWAPGAGHASQVGQTNTGNIAGFAGGLAGGGAPDTPSPSASTCVGLSAAMGARFDRVAAKTSVLPKDGYDPAARGAELADTDAVFAYVRDRIRTETYAGAMRGAGGTLQSRGGSPADKALLLGALLATKSVAVRYVHAPLSDADAARVASAAAVAPAPDAAPLPGDSFAQLDTDAATARAGAAAVRKRAEDGAAAVLADARAATDDILHEATSGNVRVGDDANAAATRAVAALHDHWWVQAQENGAWVDLDPSLSTSTAGTHLGAAPTDAPADSLPDSAIRTLTVRLTADRISGGTPATSTLIERTIKTTDSYAVPIVVTIGDRSRGSDTLAAATTFTPSISVGGDDKSGDAFSADGLAVVRLQIETALGTDVRKIASRVVLDRRTGASPSIDPSWTAAKTSAALTATYAILAPTGELDPVFAGLREAEGMQTVRAFMAYAAAGGNGRQQPPSTGIAEAYPYEALHFFEADALLRRLLESGSNGAVRFAVDRPMIALSHHGFALRDGKLDGIAAFDIVDNGTSAAGSDRAASVRANVTRGYADTYLEQHLFAAPNDGGTIALFAAAKKAGVATHVVNGDEYGGTALVPVTTVALEGKPRTGWWQLDATDGNLVGRMDDGAGQELAEYAIARANDWSTLYAMMQFYGDFFRCIAGGVEAPLMGDQAHAQQWFTQCAGAAICSYLEALASGEGFSRIDASDAEALLYNILDLSVPGAKDSLPPTGGAACSGPLYSS